MIFFRTYCRFVFEGSFVKRGLAICSVAAWISILFWGGTPAWSQSLTSLQGTVTDPSGAAVVNAIVHLINSANNSDHAAITDNRGRYSFSKVAPGTYHLLIEVHGFESFEQTDIHLLANSPATLDVKLTIAQVQQSVTVRPQGSEQCLAPLARIFPDVGAGLRTIRRGPSGNYYVLTAPGAAAMIYSPDGKQIGQVPAVSSLRSSADSSILNGADLQVDSAGRVFVADLAANAVKIYSAKGVLIGKIHVLAPISVEPLPDGQVAVASLSSQHLVDVYDDARGELYRSFGDIPTPMEKCDPDILSCTEQPQDSQPTTNRPWFYGDSAGNVYVNVVDPATPVPTIRKYDAYGIRAYEFALPISASNNSNWTVNSALAGASTAANSASGKDAPASGGPTAADAPGSSPLAGTPGTRSARGQGEGRMRLGVQLIHHADVPTSNPLVDAIGVDSANSDVWAVIGANLIHLDQQGELEASYCLSGSDQSTVKFDTILVEPDRILLGSDPFGIFEYRRPDKLLPNAAAPH